MAQIVSSQIVTATVQADGTRSVHECHTDSTERSYDIQYFAPAGMDVDAVLALRAANISAELASKAAAEAAAANYTLPLTRREFLSRFTVQERVGIRQARKTDPVVDDFMRTLEVALDVTPGHPDVQADMQYLVAEGLLSSARAAEIGA